MMLSIEKLGSSFEILEEESVSCVEAIYVSIALPYSFLV
jgi:hypothetical protein